uniref:Uncharacterized protein n=1 Tax=Panagrolaimus sp. PS1159 TaxID=55785 RepID=A0AC35F4A0_9BILA
YSSQDRGASYRGRGGRSDGGGRRGGGRGGRRSGGRSGYGASDGHADQYDIKCSGESKKGKKFDTKKQTILYI